MQKNLKHVGAFLVSTLLFVLLFYQKTPGLNILIFTTFQLFVLWKFFPKKNKLALFVYAGHLVNAMFFVINFNAFGLFVFVFNQLLLFGVIFGQYESLLHLLGASFYGLIAASKDGIKRIKDVRFLRGRFNQFRHLRMAVIPLIIVAIFISLYTFGSQYFGDFLSSFFKRIEVWIDAVLEMIEPALLGSIILGIISSLVFMLRRRPHSAQVFHLKSKIMNSFAEQKGNKQHLFSCISTFVLLNILIVFMNVLEIGNVWLGFEWKGQLLKGFVHQGTFALLASIVVSIGVVLFYFRESYKKVNENKTVKTLARIWLGMNLIMVVSVVIRTFWYIQYFGLAYKRIAVLFFLLACVYGLWTTFIKINKNWHVAYLAKKNALFIYCLICLSGFLSWDIVISKYNFKHQDRSFVDLAYLRNMSPKALPYIDKDLQYLEHMNKVQMKALPFVVKNYHAKQSYRTAIELKWFNLTKKQNESSWLSWNYKEQRAMDWDSKMRDCL